MKKAAISTIIFLAIVRFSFAADFTDKKQDLTIAAPAKSLRVGEKLQYTVEWLGIPIGNIILNITGIEKVGRRDCYHITAQAIPNKFFSRFYDFEYLVHTYIDTDNFYSHRFEKIRRIKDESTRVIINFDWQKNEAIYISSGSAPGLNMSPARNRISSQKGISTRIPPGTQDLFSSLYYFRLLRLEKNRSYSMNIYYDQRNWLTDIKVKEPFLRELRKKGTFALFEVSMGSELSEFILGKRSRLCVYFTADSRRLPFEFKLGTALGPMRGIIQDISD